MNRPTQAMMEAMFSQRNIHAVLHSSIEQQLDKIFAIWAIGFHIRLDNYLYSEYYPSKMKRIAELKEFMAKNGLDSIVIALIAAVIRGKRDQTIQQVLGYLETYIPHENIFNRITTAGELLALGAREGGFYEIIRTHRTESPQVIVNHWNTILDTFHDQMVWIDNTFFNPPLVEKPKKVTSNYSCGYHTINEPLVLGQHTQHKHNLSYDVLNILNEIPWYLDSMVLTHPEKPSKVITDPQEQANYVKHVQQAGQIYQILGQDQFNLAWQYDSRGRMYSHGYHVNFQSYEYKKALLNFGEERIINC